MYGKKFYPEEDRIDYPHNPIISSFLYSGIIGGLFYVYFLVLSFYYYWKYRKHHALFFILYLTTFAFIFISSDSHFNVPIFAMLSLVPFITKQVVEEKEPEKPA
jgi:O-antigen ligase